jgi:hypothetical protein
MFLLIKFQWEEQEDGDDKRKIDLGFIFGGDLQFLSI